MTDFLIVGRGLAAAVLMHRLRGQGLSFTVIGDPGLSACSRVAAGIWHPVVFKRLTKSWMAETLIPHLLAFYRECEQRLGVKLVTERRLIRPFGEDQEKALWRKKASAELEGFIDPEIYDDLPSGWEHCRIPNGYGVVRGCGNLDVRKFLEVTDAFFSDSIITERFDHSLLEAREDHVGYKQLKAGRIVFCEGPLIRENPFFGWVPMRLAKGEVMTVAIDKVKFDRLILNKNGFLMDLGDGNFRVGATYGWEELSDMPTPAGKLELRSKLESIVDCPYEVSAHEAGVRPSSFDRRPIMGCHPAHPRILIFNGLGTKGVMLAPWFAAKFVNFCLRQEPLHPEVDVSRFYSLYDAEQKA